ncbi:MAG: D-alanine--D-alanine ligase family protein [Pseudomonadota bacterium]
MKNKLQVGVVFGGRSGEHEVSLVSATSVMSALDKGKYDVIPIGVTKDGRWFAGEGVMGDLKGGKTPPAEAEVSILPEPSRKGLFNLKSGKITPIDVIFPVLHGTYAEDGTMQGLFDLAQIPYVGAGVLGSSVGMDKIVQKDIVKQASINVAPAIWFLSKEFAEDQEKIIEETEKKISYPCFVKPANSGSSVGISKAHDRRELVSSIKDALRYDRRVLVEKGIENAHEVEVSILGNDSPKASCVGEIIPSNEFYDYDAKYVDGKSRTEIPAELPEKLSSEIQRMAMRAYRALDCSGMARVDFLVKGDAIYYNELNTIPGFTSISMYPKLMEASGTSYSKLLDDLIALAAERFEVKKSLLTSYQPKEDWFKH